jgi:hypothetical protein
MPTLSLLGNSPPPSFSPFSCSCGSAKKMLLDKMDILDKKEEHTPLTVQEKELQVEMHIRLKKLLRDEEIKWRRRAKEKDLKEGDGNTWYFHLKASGRRKNNHISVLQNNGEEIMGDSDLIKHVSELYKQLFGPSHVTSLRMDGMVCNQLSEEYRQSLIRPFSLEEIKDTIDELKHDKAAGPDGFPAEFYQQFWESIKHDLKEMLDKFHSGHLDIERLNHGVISLIPKVLDANVVQQFRPICLLNVSYKILTKILENRLRLIIHKVISYTQIDFIKDRFIMEGIVNLHETIHEIHHKKLPGVLFKIDF